MKNIFITQTSTAQIPRRRPQVFCCKFALIYLLDNSQLSVGNVQTVWRTYAMHATIRDPIRRARGLCLDMTISLWSHG